MITISASHASAAAAALMAAPRQRHAHREARWLLRARDLLAFARVGRFGSVRGGPMPSALTDALTNGSAREVVRLVRSSRDLRLVLLGFTCALRANRPRTQRIQDAEEAQAGTELDEIFTTERDVIQTLIERAAPTPAPLYRSASFPMPAASAAAAAAAACKDTPVTTVFKPDVASSPPLPAPSPPPPLPPLPPFAALASRARSVSAQPEGTGERLSTFNRAAIFNARGDMDDHEDDDNDADEAASDSADGNDNNDAPGLRSTAALRFGIPCTSRKSSVASRGRRAPTPSATGALLGERRPSDARTRPQTNVIAASAMIATNKITDTRDASAHADRTASASIPARGTGGDDVITMTQPYDSGDY